MDQTAVVILNWNKSDLTINFVRQLKLVEKNIDIIVIDNGSNQEEREKIHKFAEINNYRIFAESDLEKIREILDFPKGQDILILLDHNYGYAKGNNFGLKFAYRLGYKYALIANNDIEINSPVLEKMLRIFQKDNKIAVVGPKVIGIMGETQGHFIRPGIFDYVLVPIFFPVLIFFLGVYIKIFRKLNKIDDYEIAYGLSGCFMLVRLDAMNEVGYFDERTFLYAEELILSEKLLSKGYKIVHYPEVSVKHLHGQSTKMLGEKKRYFMMVDADLFYLKEYRNYSKIKLGLVKFAKTFWFYVWWPILFFISKSIEKLRKN
ncbi:MAG: glycosyltransferase family 2 protein [Candidatus Aenigmatarchaeota archaeon]